MEIPVMLIFFSIPSILYAAIRSLRRKPFAQTRRNVGWMLCKWSDILWAIGVFALITVISFAALKFVPTNLLSDASRYSGQPLNVRSVLAALGYEALYIALGEEVFFRGFLASWLMRRIGFRWGNLAQAAIFLLPHLLLINFGWKIWPIFIVQFCAGWLQGWLLYKSGSILPSWLVHTATNLASAISAMG